MARIDRLIATLVEHGIPLATIQSDKPVMLDMGGGTTKPLSSKELSASQVSNLLKEVIPRDLIEDLRQIGRVEFDYDAPVGSVHVMALKRQGRLSLYVTVLNAMADDKSLDAAQELDAESSVAIVTHLSSDGPQSQEPEDPEVYRQPDYQPTHNVEPIEMPSELGGAASSFVDAAARPAAAQIPSHREVTANQGRPIPYAGPGQAVEIDRYLKFMLDHGCSDLHLTSGNPPLYRKDGEMAHLDNMPVMKPADTERLILPIMPDRNYEEFTEIRDTDFAHEIKGVGRFRCNVFMDRNGPGAVFRIIPSDILTAEDLKLPQKVLDLCYLSKGLVVVTGPTGSGKSTTLAAMIDYINRKRSTHIITVEDPIEFVHPNKKSLINQREIGVHTMSFKNALRAALREDPDIVLVGEMRDLETIAIAIETAETGHLVFGTLHTNTAPSTVDRIIDQFPPDRQAQVRTMLSESLKAVIAQNLCKKVGGGRVAALEILMVTHAISNLIREGKTFQIPSMMETKKKEGNVTLNASLLQLVKSNKVTPDEAYLKAADKDAIRRMLEQNGFRLTVV